jgi:hypothetical protein
MAAAGTVIGTPMEDAEKALAILVQKVKPILDKITHLADSDNPKAYAKIKQQEARLLTEWIITILNHSQMLEVQVGAAELAVGALDAELKQERQGKGLWTPRPVETERQVSIDDPGIHGMMP